jgi:hypothetical protein
MCEASANEGRRQYNQYGDDPRSGNEAEGTSRGGRTLLKERQRARYRAKR